MMSEPNQSGGKQNGAVGYRRPPVNRQFKPGQSGNPRGRPKVSKNFAMMVAEALNEKIKVRAKDGRIRTLTKQELMVEVMVNKAVAGDPKAFATVVQFADKFEVFKQQTQNYRELEERTLLKLAQGLGALGLSPPEKQESTPQKESQNSPAQPNRSQLDVQVCSSTA